MALSMVSRVRSAFAGGSDEPATIAAEIEAAAAEARSARAEADRLNASAAAELDDDKSEELLKQARAPARAAGRALERIAALRERLVAANFQKKRAAFDRHRRAIIAAYRALDQQLDVALVAQTAAIDAFKAAVAELGQDAEVLVPREHYAGLLFPDLVAMWRLEKNREIAALAARELRAPVPPAAAAPVAKGQLPPTIGAEAHRPVVLRGGVPQLQPSPELPSGLPPTVDNASRTVRLGEMPAPTVRQPLRPPRRDPAPAKGEAQITMLRGGVELPGGPSRTGDVVTLPADHARQLVERGAADFTELSNGKA